MSALRSVFALVFLLGLIGGCQQTEPTAAKSQPRANPDLSTHERPADVSSARSSDAQNPNTSTPSSGDAMPQGKTVASAPDTEARFCVSLVYSPGYSIKLGGLEKLHPFDIAKYEKIHQQLLADGVVEAGATLEPSALDDQDLRLVHTADYLDRLKVRKNIAKYLEAEMLLAVPLSLEKRVLQPFRLASGGTLLAARHALESGIGINLGGGYHHAKPDIGEGFCVYADVPIAIRKLQKEGLIGKALVIDVDVHQGNGTALCLADDDTTFTFSMHQGDIYPIPKEVSDLDVELNAGDGDEQFIATLEKHLDAVFDQSQADICFVVGGCDPLAGDPLASLEMTHEGIKTRDAIIVENCVKRKIPVVLTLSGGYSQDAWRAQYLSVRNLIETYGMKK